MAKSKGTPKKKVVIGPPLGRKGVRRIGATKK